MSDTVIKTRWKLTLSVNYEASASEMSEQHMDAAARSALQSVIDTALKQGLLVGDTPMCVDYLDHNVEKVY